MLKNLRQAIEETGLSFEEAARRCGLERSYFRKLFERGTIPKLDTLLKISKGLGIPVENLSGSATTILPTAHKNGSAEPTAVTLPNRNQMPNDVPVMGTAAGSHLRGAFQMTSDPIDFVRRPPALTGARDIYSLFVEGESMVPQYHPADLIFVNPHKPVRRCDPVVVQCQTGKNAEIEATIGIFIKQTADKLIIQKHNPSAEIEILRTTVVSMHKVLTINELFGI